MKYTIEFELPKTKTIEDELQGAYVCWSFGGYAGMAKAKPVEEPKKGKWIKKPDLFGFSDKITVCSKCRCTAKWREESRYCPNCGVPMEVTE